MPNAKHAALITGSNKNIGRACALILAKAGCNIVVNGSKDRKAADSVAKEVQALGTEAIVAMGDVGFEHHDIVLFHRAHNASIFQDAGFDVLAVGAPVGGELHQYNSIRRA